MDTAVCATRGDSVLHEELLGLDPDGNPRHSTVLLAEVERAVAAAGGWSAVGRIAVGLGPGSFIGIRIGLATARGLAASTGLPVTGVCTLDALGQGMAAQASSVSASREVGVGGRGDLAVLDASRGEVFAALYSEGGERRWDPFVASPEKLSERIAELSVPPRGAGSGAIRFRHELASRGVEVPDDDDPVHRVAARHVCALAAAARHGDDGRRIDPIYLRPPDAQRWRERDNPQTAK